MTFWRSFWKFCTILQLMQMEQKKINWCHYLLGSTDGQVCSFPEILLKSLRPALIQDLQISVAVSIVIWHWNTVTVVLNLFVYISFLVAAFFFQRVSSQVGLITLPFQAARWGRPGLLGSTSRLHSLPAALWTYQILPAFKKELVKVISTVRVLKQCLRLLQY